MIAGETNSESRYREVYLDSSSSLKDFSVDRKLYFRRYINNEEIRERDDDNKSIIVGKIAETLLFESERFDERFYLSSCANIPSGMMYDFVIALADLSIEFPNKEFKDVAQEAYDKSGYKISLERVLKTFDGSDAEIYYNELLTIKMNHLDVVTLQDVSNAENIVNELRTNPITKDIVNMVDSSRYKVMKQFQIEGYEVDDHLMKSMIDLAIADFDKRIIDIYDLKVTWSTENFVENYYLYRRSYIQAYVYYKAMLSLTMNKDHEFYGFIVNPPKFIVADSSNYYSPLIYTLDIDDLNDAYTGFEHKGKTYPGVHEIIDNLKWALEYNIWNISKESYLSGGIVNIKSR